MAGGRQLRGGAADAPLCEFRQQCAGGRAARSRRNVLGERPQGSRVSRRDAAGGAGAEKRRKERLPDRGARLAEAPRPVRGRAAAAGVEGAHPGRGRHRLHDRRRPAAGGQGGRPGRTAFRRRIPSGSGGNPSGSGECDSVLRLLQNGQSVGRGRLLGGDVLLQLGIRRLAEDRLRVCGRTLRPLDRPAGRAAQEELFRRHPETDLARHGAAARACSGSARWTGGSGSCATAA